MGVVITDFSGGFYICQSDGRTVRTARTSRTEDDGGSGPEGQDPGHEEPTAGASATSERPWS